MAFPNLHDQGVPFGCTYWAIASVASSACDWGLGRTARSGQQNGQRARDRLHGRTSGDCCARAASLATPQNPLTLPAFPYSSIVTHQPTATTTIVLTPGAPILGKVTVCWLIMAQISGTDM